MTQTAPQVLVIGSGLMGASVAAEILAERPGTRILMIDGGPELGGIPGQHLHDTPEREIYERYNEKTSSGVQGFYAGADTAENQLDPADTHAFPGMYDIARMGHDGAGMPGASLAWNVGGMGVHWTAACPIPWGPENFPLQGQQQWEADLARAEELLRVTRDSFGTSPAGLAILERFTEFYGPVSAPGRAPQTMPMAIEEGPDGRRRRTGPNRILPAHSPSLELRANALAVRIHHDGERATAVDVRDPRTGEISTLTADEIVVCADAMRTPQLLFASDIRPAALGAYLNEHVFVAGRVVVPPANLGLDDAALPKQREGEWATGAYWLPQSGPAQPFHAQLTDRFYAGEGYGMGISYYVPTEVRAENRVHFSDTETDALGMPRMSVDFSLSPTDEALVTRARAEQRRMGEALGDFDAARDSAVLAAGTSLHFTGTVRMGAVDDGTSVVDPECRVWGFSNLRLAGNGVIPTSMAGNVTLTGTITAVMAARSVVAGLAAREMVDLGASA